MMANTITRPCFVKSRDDGSPRINATRKSLQKSVWRAPKASNVMKYRMWRMVTETRLCLHLVQWGRLRHAFASLSTEHSALRPVF